MIRYISIIIFSFFCLKSNGQTYFYKRTKIIKDKATTLVNDDAHYITFTDKKCYDSDENGFAFNPTTGLRFIKSDKGILYYYGDSFYGTDSYLYVSDSKDRINLNNDGVIYVYERTNPKQTTARFRKTNNGMRITPVLPIQQVPSYNSMDRTRTERKKRKICPACNGTGKGRDQIIYDPNYTGRSNDRYCSICGEVRVAHRHYQPDCNACYGKGYIEY